MNPDTPGKSESRRRTLLTLAVALAAGAGGMYLSQSLHKDSAQDVPATAQAGAAKLLKLNLPDAEGRPIAFAQWSGKPLLVNFWATWCPPCREEMPMLDKAAAEHPGVQFVGISIDRADAVRSYQQANPVRFPLPVSGLDISPLAAELGNAALALPFSVFLAADGSVRHVKLGALKEAELKQFLREIEPAVQATSSPK